MPRRCVPSVLFVPLVLFVTACSKKADAPGPDGGAPRPEPRGVDSDPNAAYTLRVRDIQEGDKTEVVRYESTNQTQRGGTSTTEKLEERLEYTEHIIQMPKGAPLPTRLTRTYTIAQKSDKAGAMQPLPFQDKTVAIEKRGATYSFKVDGKLLPGTDSAGPAEEFRPANKASIEMLMPDRPVRLGDEWSVDRAVLQAFGGVPPNADFAKSKLTARLARAYTLDGKQWGQIAFDFDLVIDPDITGGKIRGLEGMMKIAGTFDVVIDGSAPDSIMKGTVKSELVGRHKASESKLESEGTIEKSVRMVR
jgi:hypothetical protein